MAEYVISAAALERNGKQLREVGDAGGAHMLIALKAYAGVPGLTYLKRYAEGCCASGLYEAKLAAEHVGGHVAVYSPAYREEELEELLDIAHHIDFNSLPQWERMGELCRNHPRAQRGEVSFGLRVNPGYSTGHTPLYDPCAPGSRLGVEASRLAEAGPDLLRGISGLHLHTLCEQGAQELMDTFRAFEKSCGALLASEDIRYLNLGGGHWITQPDYDRAALVRFLREVRERYGVEVYLEPGEAWCIHTGVLRARVLDIFESLGYRHAVLDVSVSAHMPDVLEMPYRPQVYLARTDCSEPLPASSSQLPAVCLPGEHYLQAGMAEEGEYRYRLGAPTCLAGDVLGDFSFPCPLRVGDVLVMDDMTHYTMVKTTHFNGVPHPDIVMLHPDGRLECTRRFGYEDYAKSQ